MKRKLKLFVFGDKFTKIQEFLIDFDNLSKIAFK